MSDSLILLGIGLAAISGLPGLFFSRSSMGGQWVTTFLAVAAAALGLFGVGDYWSSRASRPIAFSWNIPGAEFSVEVDGLSAIFLLPIFLISLLGNIYGLGYWKQPDHPGNGRKLRLFYGMLTAGMALVVIARNSILFIFAWELMALSAFFLVTTEDHQQDVRETGWIYLLATHTATLCLFLMFALFRAASGSFALVPLDRASLTHGAATSIFVLALVGFGIKAGVMPLHVWLPSSHAIAPSHVSAIMSGVIIKMGIYGMVRVTSLLPDPPLSWGLSVLGLGMGSGVLGVAFAIGQHDLKRLLAYHSIENIGIIVMGLGLALIGRSLNRADWVVLGLSGGLLHVWNHALFKSLLFLSAGSVIHATGTREIDRLGGLSKLMPRTAVCFLAGAVAICGLPPLNGFVSEFLIYLGLFSTLDNNGGHWILGAVFAAPALALIGALATACFVKVFGAAFLGSARSDAACHAHEAPWSMLGPMGVLVACCCLIGISPTIVVPVVCAGVDIWAPELAPAAARLEVLAPLNSIGALALSLVASLAGCMVALNVLLSKRAIEKNATWGCGYAAPTVRMQYTSSSFAQMLVGMFGWVLRPRVHVPTHLTLFPGKSNFHSHVLDPVLDEGVVPMFRLGALALSSLRVFQRGNIQTYLLYIFLAVLALLLWR